MPRSPIRFDKDRLAPFIDTDISKEKDLEDLGLTYEIADLYSRSFSMSQIKKEKKMHQEEVKREVRKALKWFVERYAEERINSPD